MRGQGCLGALMLAVISVTMAPLGRRNGGPRRPHHHKTNTGCLVLVVAVPFGMFLASAMHLVAVITS